MPKEHIKYNPEENLVVPQNVRFDPELSAGAKLFYAELKSFCKNGTAPFDQKRLAKMIKVSYPTVINWTKKLIDEGYIEIMLNSPKQENRYRVKIKK